MNIEHLLSAILTWGLSAISALLVAYTALAFRAFRAEFREQITTAKSELAQMTAAAALSSQREIATLRAERIQQIGDARDHFRSELTASTAALFTRINGTYVRSGECGLREDHIGSRMALLQEELRQVKVALKDEIRVVHERMDRLAEDIAKKTCAHEDDILSALAALRGRNPGAG